MKFIILLATFFLGCIAYDFSFRFKSEEIKKPKCGDPNVFCCQFAVQKKS